MDEIRDASPRRGSRECDADTHLDEDEGDDIKGHEDDVRLVFRKIRRWAGGGNELGLTCLAFIASFSVRYISLTPRPEMQPAIMATQVGKKHVWSESATEYGSFGVLGI